MPPMFYVPHENPTFDNAVSYLPADMIPKPPKRAGVAFQLPTQTAAQPPAAAAKRAAATSDNGSGDAPAATAADIDTPDQTPETPAASSETIDTPPPAKRTRKRIAIWLTYLLNDISFRSTRGDCYDSVHPTSCG